jgi:excisionase family DNA binding protein
MRCTEVETKSTFLLRVSVAVPVHQPPPERADRLLRATEVAELLAVPESWVREQTRSGRLPHVNLGLYRRYRREAVLRWLDEQEAGGAPWRKHRPRPPSQ